MRRRPVDPNKHKSVMNTRDVLMRHRLFRAEVLLQTANELSDEKLVNEAIDKALELIKSTIELLEEENVTGH